VTLSESCRIRCQGRVLRTTETSWDEVGVATEVSRYAFLSEERLVPIRLNPEASGGPGCDNPTTDS
jgi:hypothetical protein